MRLSSIIGQDRAVGQLAAALERGRVHHAWLFAGPPGVGKETTAMAFAASLLCGRSGDGPLVDACGECASCRKVERGVHPDLLLLLPEAEAVARKKLAREDLGGRAPSRELKIDQIRAVEARLVHAPLEARRRVVLLLGAGSMNAAAQNAFLKTLEEPPANTHLILVADAAESLLPTIRSRCLRVSFAPLTTELIAARLREARGLDEEVAQVLAAVAGGSLGAALFIDPADLEDRAATLQMVEALVAADLRPVLALAESLGAKGREQAELSLELLSLFYRDVAFLAEGADDAHLANRDLLPLLRSAAERGAGDALRRHRLVSQARQSLRRHVSARLVFEELFLRFVMPEAAAE